jgi:hydroxymethylbilane synthase
MSDTIVIGSRGSDLALWQAHHVQNQLKNLGFNSIIKIIKTRGDKIQHLSFDKLEGKGFFTKEIEDALLAKEIDLAVHSHKDLETNPPKGLIIAAVSEREDPSELLLIRKEAVDDSKFWGLKENAVVGTSSSRRKSQILLFRDDVQLKDLRGNVPTRIQKLRDGNYDAILLAKAGVTRLKLDISDLYVKCLPRKWFVPAPAQGVLGLQIREGDFRIQEIVTKINSSATQETINVERKVLNLFNGGCQLPLGVYCEKDSGKTKIWVSILRPNESFPLRLYKENISPEKLVQLLNSKIDKNKKVFISREINEASIFQKILANQNVSVFGKALIKIEFKEIKNIPDSDWVFFTSSNSVQSLKMYVDYLKTKKIAAFGMATEMSLKKLGLKSDFIGEGHPEDIAVNFAAVLNTQKVLFPTSNRSLKTIQSKISPENQVELVTYETNNIDNKIQDFEVLVFTSPSNVNSYISCNDFNPKQKVVAIGPSTKASLMGHGFKEVYSSWESSELALSDQVMSVFYN